MKVVGSAALAKAMQLIQAALAAKSDSAHTHAAATASSPGLMAAADKAKLDGVASGANTVKAAAAASLTSAGWTGAAAPYTQTVSVPGATAGNSVLVSPAPGSRADYAAAGCYCSAQAVGTLTFACAVKPTGALTVNVLALS